MIPAHPLLAENALFHSIGTLFHPVFVAVAYSLSFIFGIVPNYALAIVILTVVIMAILTPLTVKSTKSMIAMQRLQPEIKKLQQKYKGAENREQMNQELMRLYREQGVSPAGGCLPMLLQMPFLFVLYDVIRGLAATKTIQGHVVPSPSYIPHTSKMYTDLIHSGGAMMSFGMNLALKPFSHHSSTLAAVPFFGLVLVAVVLQYVQMKQMNSRNPQAAQANPQMQTMQKVMPVVFAYIYFLIPAAVVIYMIISTLIRIGTQDVMFRTGIVQPVGVERAIGGAAPAKSAGEGGGTAGKPGTNGAGPRPGAAKPGAAKARGSDGPSGASSPADGGTTSGSTETGSAARPHPRSKDKRQRKAR